MGSKNDKPRERKIGRQQDEKKPLIDPRYKNLIYTSIFIVIVIIFFIVNNSQSEAPEGPYPPTYHSAQGK